MKNLKKIAALGAATVMAMSMSVSAFAAGATYEAGAVKLTNLEGVIDAEHQWTVIVIKNDEETTTKAALTADDLYYINQGTSGEYFWTNGMGTKIDLADGQHDGDYLVRIGGETITDAQGIIEIPFNITTKPDGKTITVKWGDITGDGAVDGVDALAALLNRVGVQESYTIGDETVAVGSEFAGHVWGDITGDGAVDGVDALAALLNRVGVQESYTINGESVNVGSDITLTVPQK